MIKLEGMTKNYKDFRTNISLEVLPGRVTGLIGKNGAGKSTTIKAILGLIRPDQGMVSVFGKNAGDLTARDRERIGVSLSDSGFSEYLCINDIAKIMKKMYQEFDEAKFRRLCEEQELSPKKQMKDYSTGMKAKLRVICALCYQADILIMDEPTAGLDVEARGRILDLLREYLAEDEERSVLITSHIAGDLEGLCDDIYLIHNGTILLHEETDVVLSQYGILKVGDAQYEKLDRSYIEREQKENFGYVLLTKEKQFYEENYPEIVIEKCGIDELILAFTGGER